MRDMQHSAAVAREEPHPATHAAAPTVDPCRHRACNDRSVFLRDETDGATHLALTQRVAAGPDTALPNTSAQRVSAPKLPPRPSGSPVSLHTTLRV